MKVITILYTFIVAAMAQPERDSIPDVMTYVEWLDEFGGDNRWFQIAGTHVDREKIFNKNIVRIKIQNELYKKGKSSFMFGVNEFADLTEEEFAKVVGLGEPFKTGKRKKPAKYSKNNPEEVDWRKKGAVTEVKNQGQCGSCWSFSATGAVEGAVAVSNGKLISLSEMELVRCSKKNQGCKGGLMDYAFQYIIDNKGLASDKDYPYTPADGDCDTTKQALHSVSISGFQDVKPKSVDAMESAVSKGPVAVAIQANRMVFQLYKGGVLDKFRCGTRLDHGVLVVGYTSKSNKDYPDAFIVKNSWGPKWGVEGYIYIGKDTKFGAKGICGILAQPSYPTGAKVLKEPEQLDDDEDEYDEEDYEEDDDDQGHDEL